MLRQTIIDLGGNFHQPHEGISRLVHASTVGSFLIYIVESQSTRIDHTGCQSWIVVMNFNIDCLIILSIK